MGSRFNDYAKRLDTLARKNFTKYCQAEKEYEDARETLAQYPQRIGSTSYEYERKRLKAAAAYNDAKAAFDGVKREYADSLKDFAEIREELATEIEKTYAVDPERLDNNTLKLMESGVLKPADYVKIMDDARNSGNHTMIRLIGKYAAEASKAIESSAKDQNTIIEGRERLNAVVSASKTDDGREYLEAFDYLTDVYERSVRNPGLIDHWDQLTETTIENF